MFHVVLSAPSGRAPQHLIDTLNGRPYTVMTDGWETDQLAVAASAFSRFVYLKESARIFPGFWEIVDTVRGSAWMFPRPSCYMGVFDSAVLRRVLAKMPKTTSKQDSIDNESRIHDMVQWRSIWPDVSDFNALRVEDGELVIGNEFIEKSKGTARCGRCTDSAAPGVCKHLLAAFG